MFKFLINDIVIITLLQIALQLDVYVLGIPSFLFIVCSFLMISSIYNRIGSLSFIYKYFPLLWLSVLIVLVNYTFNYDILSSFSSFNKSSSHFCLSLFTFYIATIYFKIHSANTMIARVALYSVVIIVILSIFEITLFREIFDALRLILYGKSSLTDEYLQRTTNIAGFYRPALLASEPAYLARHLVINYFLFLFSMRKTNFSDKSLLAIAVLFLSAGFLTGSPIGIAGSLLISFFLLTTKFCVRHSTINYVAVFSLLIMLVIIASSFFLLSTHTSLVDRFSNILNGSDKSSQARFAGPSIAIDVVAKRPLAGVGFGQLALVKQYSDNELLSSPEVYGEAKDVMTNAIAALFIIAGLPSLALYLFVHSRYLLGKDRVLPITYLWFFIFYSFIQGGVLSCSYWMPLGAILGISNNKFFLGTALRQSE